MAPFSPFPRARPRGKNCGGSPKIQVVYCSPSVAAPWTRPATRPGGAWVLTIVLLDAGRKYDSLLAAQDGGGPDLSRAAPGRSGPLLRLILTSLVLLFTRFLASTFSSESGLHTLFLAGLQVKGVALNLLDNVFLLHLALETSQSVLEGFALLKSYFCQTDTPPNPSGWTE